MPDRERGEWSSGPSASELERAAKVEIALVGKYVKLQTPTSPSTRRSSTRASNHGCSVRVRWFDAEGMSLEEAQAQLEQVDGVLVPGGFGSRGWEGNILACRVARDGGIPYLGICLRMHVAVSEFARYAVGLDGGTRPRWTSDGLP